MSVLRKLESQTRAVLRRPVETYFNGAGRCKRFPPAVRWVTDANTSSPQDPPLPPPPSPAGIEAVEVKYSDILSNNKTAPKDDPHPFKDSQGAGSSSESLRTHQFDTYKLVSALQRAGYNHQQAVALMKCLRAVLINGTEFAKEHYLSRGDLENVNHTPRLDELIKGNLSFPCRDVGAKDGSPHISP